MLATTRGVVIAGAAGVGKTRLAREVLRRAEASGECTKWIVGTESARALPLGAFIGALGDAMSDPLANVRRVINSFVAQQRRGRVVVGVDDAHLLFGELRRASAGEMHLSAIRGKLATRLAQNGDNDMHATVRRALLRLESDLGPDPELYLESARHAMTLLDLDLADRFATAATQAGAPGAAGVRAMNLVLLGRGEPAEAALRAMADGDVPDGHHWATVRAHNLIWMLSKPQDAAVILDGLAAGPETPAQVAERLAVQACLDAVSARCESAAEKARAALDFPALPAFHAMSASMALIMAMGALGQVDELAGVAEQALRRATTSFQASHMRFWFGAVYGRACRLTGRIDEFVNTARQLADSARDVPGLAYANLALLLGNADLARGAVADAARLVHEAVAGAEIHAVSNGFAAGELLRLGRGARQARRTDRGE